MYPDTDLSQAMDCGFGGRWVQINNAVVPCLWSTKGCLLAPLQVAQVAAGIGLDLEQNQDTDQDQDWTLSSPSPSSLDLHPKLATTAQCARLDDMCAEAGLHFEFPRKTALVRLRQLLTVASKLDHVFVKTLPSKHPLEDVEYQPKEQHVSERGMDSDHEQDYLASDVDHDGQDNHHSDTVLAPRVSWSPPTLELPHAKEMTPTIKSEPLSPDHHQRQQQTLHILTNKVKDRGDGQSTPDTDTGFNYAKYTGQPNKGRLQVWAASSTSLGSGGAMTVRTGTTRPLVSDRIPMMTSQSASTLSKQEPDTKSHSQSSHHPGSPNVEKRKRRRTNCHAHLPYDHVMTSSSSQRAVRNGISGSRLGPTATTQHQCKWTPFSRLGAPNSTVLHTEKTCSVKFFGKTITCVVDTINECYISLDTLWQNYFSENVPSPLVIRHFLESDKQVTWMPTSTPRTVMSRACDDVYARLRDVARHMEEMQWVLVGYSSGEQSICHRSRQLDNNCCYHDNEFHVPVPGRYDSSDFSDSVDLQYYNYSNSNEDLECQVPLDLSCSNRSASV